MPSFSRASLPLFFFLATQVACGGYLNASPGDAGADATGVVACAAATCSLGAGQICCMENGPAPQCTTTCPSGDDSIACDGPEDCPGQVCCEGPFSTGSHAACAAECVLGRTIRVCHETSDCPDDAGCCPVNATVYPGFNACTGGC